MYTHNAPCSYYRTANASRHRPWTIIPDITILLCDGLTVLLQSMQPSRSAIPIICAKFNSISGTTTSAKAKQ